MQYWLAVQAIAQTPQFAKSVWRFTQRPAQSSNPVAHGDVVGGGEPQPATAKAIEVNKAAATKRRRVMFGISRLKGQHA